ncbi:hypothetical protein BCON_0067g00220 [Botryotinia convoluta]|uniref:Uncharacterized protein n=1 Tax=Botryotinia convoluta TaxID=54673 RepID=A0A4Z1I6S1_9HELO|nr:hypothetical protein BCON_0067g00220 [Botryotinia convoluta]
MRVRYSVQTNAQYYNPQKSFYKVRRLSPSLYTQYVRTQPRQALGKAAQEHGTQISWATHATPFPENYTMKISRVAIAPQPFLRSGE